MSKGTISRYKIGEIIKIRNLVGHDEMWNGTRAMITSEPYIQPDYGVTLIDIQIDGITGFALEPWNIEKITAEEYEAEYDSYVDAKYLDPLHVGVDYDGRRIVNWVDCVWKPRHLRL